MRATVDLNSGHADGIRMSDDAFYNLLLFRVQDFNEALIEVWLVLL